MGKEKFTPEAGDSTDTSDTKAPVAKEAEGREVAGVTEQVSHGLTEEAIIRGFDKWVADRLANSDLSRSTEAWNLLQKEKAMISAYILKEVQ